MEQLYFFCAVFGSLFVVAQFFLTLFAGFGIEDSASDVPDTEFSDGDIIPADHSGYDFLRILSLRTVTAGIAFFGLAGMAAAKSQIGKGTALAIAVASGLTALLLVFFLYRMISSLKSNGAVTLSSLPGSKGNVYLKVAAKRSAAGKVIVNHQGRSMEYEAFTDADDDLKTGEPIFVKEVIAPNQVLVERYAVPDDDSQSS